MHVFVGYPRDVKFRHFQEAPNTVHCVYGIQLQVVILQDQHVVLWGERAQNMDRITRNKEPGSYMLEQLTGFKNWKRRTSWG